MATLPLTEGLFTWPDADPVLLGGQCPACSAITFPTRSGCPRCGSTGLTEYRLAKTGVLWSWTSQGFMPKAPFVGEFASSEPFEPWFVGVVELPGELRLESILVGCTQATLRIGMPMRLDIMPFRIDDAGNQIVTYAFRPAPVTAPTDTKEAGRA
ncbi:MAG: uncharacterized protein V7637_1152 [Mycobacteriales bacterium]|jgi:uncharacterized OB-fold protein